MFLEDALILHSQKMNILFIALLIGLTSCADDKDDPRKYLDNINVEEVTKDEVFMKSVFACLLDEKPCGDIQYIKDAIPVVMASKCSDCSEKQKDNFNKLNKALLDKYPDQYKTVVDKYSKDN